MTLELSKDELGVIIAALGAYYHLEERRMRQLYKKQKQGKRTHTSISGQAMWMAEVKELLFKVTGLGK